MPSKTSAKPKAHKTSCIGSDLRRSSNFTPDQNVSFPKRSSTPPPTLAEARHASDIIRKFFPPSPLADLGDHHAKLELRLPTGSFKVRGALVALTILKQSLDPDSDRRIVVASAGNHGKGIAWAAAHVGLEATIVVPSNCPPVKLEAMQQNAEVVVMPSGGYDEAETFARKLSEDQAIPFVSPFDDTWVMAGNGGSLMLELLDQLPTIATVVVPVGGGGLLSGILSVLSEARPDFDVVAVQAEASPAFCRSLSDKCWHENWPVAETVAEGLEGGTGLTGLVLARSFGVRAVTVDEKSIRRAMVALSDQLGQPVEGSAAVVEAARLDGCLDECKRPVVQVVTGGNVSAVTIEAMRKEQETLRVSK